MSWEGFPNTGLSKTYNTDSQTPDSAGTMTAIATGVKTHMGAIGVAAGRRNDCAGSLHTSVMEILLRGGAGGALVLACPPRDCWHREGPRWLVERVYHEREAELQARVDRARVRIAHAGAGERGLALAALHGFAADVARLDPPAAARTKNVEPVCDRLEPAGRT